jgi:hypothetical protein
MQKSVAQILIPVSLLGFTLAFGACSFEDTPGNENQSVLASVPSTYMQVRRGLSAAPVYSDMYLSQTISGVGGGMPLIRNLTRTLDNGVLVMRVNVRGGTLANREVWINASNVEFRSNASADAYRNEAAQLAQQARNAGFQADKWQAAANAARFLCISGVGAGAALAVVTMGAETVGRSALIALIGFQTLKPLLDCAGIDPNSFGK